MFFKEKLANIANSLWIFREKGAYWRLICLCGNSIFRRHEFLGDANQEVLIDQYKDICFRY